MATGIEPKVTGHEPAYPICWPHPTGVPTGVTLPLSFQDGLEPSTFPCEDALPTELLKADN